MGNVWSVLTEALIDKHGQIRGVWECVFPQLWIPGNLLMNAIGHSETGLYANRMSCFTRGPFCLDLVLSHRLSCPVNRCDERISHGPPLSASHVHSEEEMLQVVLVLAVPFAVCAADSAEQC